MRSLGPRLPAGNGTTDRSNATGGWLKSEREPQCTHAVEGQWRERGTPFSKLSESATHGERSQEQSTASMLAVRIHSYGDPTGVRIARAPRPEPGRGQILVRVKAAGVNPPRTLDFPGAAAIPIGALTAHQALFDAAELLLFGASIRLSCNSRRRRRPNLGALGAGPGFWLIPFHSNIGRKRSIMGYSKVGNGSEDQQKAN
jgi:hypothetical protein